MGSLLLFLSSGLLSGAFFSGAVAQDTIVISRDSGDALHFQRGPRHPEPLAARLFYYRDDQQSRRRARRGGVEAEPEIEMLSGESSSDGVRMQYAWSAIGPEHPKFLQVRKMVRDYVLSSLNWANLRGVENVELEIPDEQLRSLGLSERTMAEDVALAIKKFASRMIPSTKIGIQFPFRLSGAVDVELTRWFSKPALGSLCAKRLAS